MLVLAWAHRMQCLFDVYVAHDPTFIYTDTDLRRYEETSQFVEWASQQTDRPVLQRIAQIPIAGGLQNSRPTEPTMGKKQIFCKDHFWYPAQGTLGNRAEGRPRRLTRRDGNLDFERNPGQAGQRFPLRGREGERHERGPWLDHGEAHATGQRQAPVSRTNLGYR
jgi:hypothetical protein